MIVSFKYRRKIALLFAFIMTAQLVAPVTAHALTSGPTQPETQGFQPIGTSDMVDLFTGDFSYNIPLLKVGEYPVNLSYHSGASLDDEASWVGYGWSLSPGVLNRQMRGLPDDFNGRDSLVKQANMKEHVVKGAKLSITLDALGIPLPKIKIGKKKKRTSLSMTPTLSLGVKFDNYQGVGVDLGFNAGLQLTDIVSGTLTGSDGKPVEVSDTSSSGLGGLNLNLSSFEGASLTASKNFNVFQKKMDNDDKVSVSKSIGLPYNSRQGLAGLTLGTSFGTTKATLVNGTPWSIDGYSNSSFISFAGSSYTPTIENPTRFNSYTFTFHTGPQLFLGFPGGGGTGFYNKQKIDPQVRYVPAYGFMHAEKGKDNVDAMMDFNREKDIPYNKAVNYLPIPVPTYDLFIANSQAGGGQYRLYRGSAGVFFDNKVSNKSFDATFGIELGAGVFVDAGYDAFVQDAKTITQKWQQKNHFLSKGDFQANSAGTPLYEQAYFKRVGEPVPADKNYFQQMIQSGPVAVKLQKNVADPFAGAEALNKLRTLSNANGTTISSPIKRGKREVRNNTFSFLTAAEAAKHGLEKTIKDYHPDSLNFGGCSQGHIRTTISRNSSYRRDHHISEVTLTDDNGGTTVYGIPTYNTYQEEVTFSVSQNLAMRKRGLIKYDALDASPSNKKGRENYYSREIMPPYATSYLLTAVLSPDYVDRTGDGVTDDDAGSAVKFNYSKLPSLYHWRTPYAYGADSANYHEGFLSEERDDKANYVYGRKEIWYLHSIESKTMIAHFILEDRNDALGVTGPSGGKNTSVRLKKLKQIRLYSKSDLCKHNGNTSQVLPIKVIDFEYKYQVCKNLPNSVGSEGKLTLTKITTTHRGSPKGLLNPYKFSYDSAAYNYYDYRQYDRWGNFKDAAHNPGGMNNSEYPYTPQSAALADSFASVGQLTRIELPSGGIINIDYEADDYAYVQDKRASIMCQVAGIDSVGRSSGLINSDKILVKLPYPVSSLSEMKYRYFQDMEQLYFKFFLDLDGKGHREFVPGYAKIKNIARYNDSTAQITLEKVDGKNAIAKAGWQFIRLSLPRYAYPGSDNYNDNGGDLIKAIKALVTALKTITELFKDFDKKAKSRDYSNTTTLNKSWVRLCAPTLMKKGGGSRVRSVSISDEWASMSGATGALTSKLTQRYEYTTKDIKNNTISSGVASYEPMLGNDENPFRQPIAYTQNHVLGLDDFFYIERPLGETFFPAPSVGYSRVSVRTIGAGDAESVNRTGVSVNEFYTAKDYPTLISETTLEKSQPISSMILKIIGGVTTDNKGFSQGYQVETNDMHGKPKTVNIFNKSGQNISSIEYFYKTVNELAPRKQLSNNVKVIDSTGTVTEGIVGLEAEIYTDMRQQTTDNVGKSIKVSGGVGSFFIFPLPFGFPGVGANKDTRNYRSSSTIKLINRFAIQYKTKKVESGSSITTENLVWDSETGNVLLTKTQNEFDDPLYSFAYPAHWIYSGMGQAYQNLGTVLIDFDTNSNGVPTNGTYNSLLLPGDELIDINSADKYWIINSPISGTYQNRLIDGDGNIQQVSDLRVKLVRSGRRNMANMAVATISSLNNPIVSDKLSISQLTKILDAKATVFKEEWSVPVSSKFVPANSGCDLISERCMEMLIAGSMLANTGLGRASIYGVQADSVTVKGIIDESWGSNGESQGCIDSIVMNVTGDSNVHAPYYLYDAGTPTSISAGDSAQLGDCKIRFTQVAARFNDLANENFEEIGQITNCGIKEPCESGIELIEDPSVDCGYIVLEVPCAIGGSCQVDTLMKFRLDCSSGGGGCLDPVGGQVNPYFAGLKGNWRPLGIYAYQVKRENFVSDPAKKGSTDIRRSGAYSIFNPFWKRNTNWEKNPTNDIRWIAANEVTYFNSKGVEVENKDALNRYSSAVFGYLESTPVAVASNTRYRELAYDGFEDYEFCLGCAAADTCNNAGHFKFNKLLNGSSIDLSTAKAHTGKYSLKITNSVTILKTVYTGDPLNLYTFDGSGQYILEANELSKGFSPIPGKKYVLSFWVYDGVKRDPTTQVQTTVNGSNLLSNSMRWPIVEGWKHIQIQFTLSSMATSFSLQLQSGGGTAYFDDIRIHPFEGQMKSYAYDASTQRLMAELDENNFATFYEYDDEGILVRVKKETEKGILTIRETRSSLKKHY